MKHFPRLIGILVFMAIGLVAPAQQRLMRQISFDCSLCSPEAALEKLGAQEGFAILYPGNMFKNKPALDIHVTQISVEDVLHRIAASVPHDIQFNGTQVLLRPLQPRTYTLSGYVRDRESGERLLGASIYSSQRKGVVSNEFGFFSLNLPAGKQLITISYVGYKQQVYTLNLQEKTFQNFDLAPNSTLDEVTISSEKQPEDSVQIQQIPPQVVLQLLKSMPMAGGIPDLMRQLSLDAGVLTGTDGLGGLNVRGGNADQNLILLDDVPVYNAGHALGLLSIFNSDLMQSATLWKGDQPARFGARSSAVLDVRTRDGDLYRHHQQISLGSYLVGFSAEGPLIKGKCAYIVGFRGAAIDPLIRFLSKKSNLATGGKSGNATYQFTDFNAKINFTCSNRDRIYLSYYNGLDSFQSKRKALATYDSLESISNLIVKAVYGNHIAALRWNHVWNDRIFSNTTATFSLFNYADNIQTDSSDLIQYAEGAQSRIEDYCLKSDFSFFKSPAVHWRWGASVTWHNFTPGVFQANASFKSGFSPDTLRLRKAQTSLIKALETQSYLQLEWRPDEQTQIDAGLNISGFFQGGKEYLRPDPRIRMLWKPTKNMHWFASASGLTQNLHQVGNYTGSLPFELWVPTTARFKPERVWLTTAGLEYHQNGWMLHVQVYKKDMRRLRTFKSTESDLNASLFLENDNWEQRLIIGKGWSRGLEITCARTQGHTTGQISYTLSRSFRQFDDANLGEAFPARFDRPHDLKIQLLHRFGKNLEASASWLLGSGNPITLSGLQYYYTLPGNAGYIPIIAIEKVNNYRLPVYHRLDLAVTAYLERKRFRYSMQVGCFNTYNRKNPFFVIYNPTLTKGNADQYTLLPFLPSIRFEMRRK